MPDFTLKMAKLNIAVHCKYDFTPKFCTAYITDEEPDFAVTVSDDEIDEEIKVSPYNPTRPYAESICVYRAIAEKLPYYDRCVFHGAVISYDSKGYIFTAPSGTGKTTHIRLWHKYLDGVDVVNGDKPVLHITEGGVTAYSTPYAGKEGYQNGGNVPLCGICLIEQAPHNSIEKIEPSDCLTRIMAQVYRPFDTGAVVKTLGMLDLLLKDVPVYLLKCNMEEGAVKCSFEAMTGFDFDERKRKSED